MHLWTLSFQSFFSQFTETSFNKWSANFIKIQETLCDVFLCNILWTYIRLRKLSGFHFNDTWKTINNTRFYSISHKKIDNYILYFVACSLRYTREPRLKKMSYAISLLLTDLTICFLKLFLWEKNCQSVVKENQQ